MSITQFQSTDTETRVESPQRSVRVLHIVENLDTQAVETWLLRVLRAAAKDDSHIDWSFFCVLGQSGRLDDEARALGAEVIHSRYAIGAKIHFMAGLREVMKRGDYDVLHCHHDIMSAAYLLASIGLPFKKRIIHLHNTSLSLPTPSRVKSQLAREPMRRICLRMADQIVGNSQAALGSLIGSNAFSLEQYKVIPYAIDTDRFRQRSTNPVVFRRMLGVSKETTILLFVGRIIAYKNPFFVLDVLEHLENSSEFVAVFAGTGNLKELEELVKRRRLEGRVRVLGFRDDIPELMRASDILLWPSLEEPMEGLGLGIIEAQAAGLPVLMSRSVPGEAIVVPELVHVLPLAAGANTWADAVVDILKRSYPSRCESLAKVEASPFSMASGVASLMSLYKGLENGRTACR